MLPSDIPLKVPLGPIRTATRSPPQTDAKASTTSNSRRDRFSIEPPSLRAAIQSGNRFTTAPVPNHPARSTGATDPAGTREPQSSRGRDRCRLFRPKPALFSLQKDRWRYPRAISGLRKKHLKHKSEQVPPRRRVVTYLAYSSR